MKKGIKDLKKKERGSSKEKDDLMDNIHTAIVHMQKEKELDKIKCLSRYDPEKVAKILYLHSIGCSQTNMIRKHNLSRYTIVQILSEYADHKSGFRELGGKLSARSYLNLESLEEDLIEGLREKMDEGYVPDFRDLKEVSIAKANSHRQAMAARGEASSVVDVNNKYSIEDFNDTLSAARDRINKAKVVEEEIDEVIDIEEEE
jgi:hypothetical protein